MCDIVFEKHLSDEKHQNFYDKELLPTPKLLKAMVEAENNEVTSYKTLADFEKLNNDKTSRNSSRF